MNKTTSLYNILYHSKVWGYVFERSLFCSRRLHLFDQKYSKYYEIILQFKIAVADLCEYLLNCNVFLWSKLNLHHHYSSLQCHMIFRNHNNILKKHFWLLSMLKTVVLHNIFVKILFFMILWRIESSKEQHLFEIEIISNIIHVFSFVQSLLKKYIYYKILFQCL